VIRAHSRKRCFSDDGWCRSFVQLTEEEIDKHLTAISDRDDE
jgi:hypothetical protein